MNNAAITLTFVSISIYFKYHVFLWAQVSNAFGLILRSMFAGYYGKSTFSFSKISCYLSKRMYHFAFPPAKHEHSFLHIFATILAVSILDFGHSDRVARDSA